MQIRSRHLLQIIEDSKLALENRQALYDRRILCIATKLRRHEPPNAGPDGSIDNEPLREYRLSFLGDSSDDGILAPQTLAQGRLGKLEFAKSYCGCDVGWGLERRFGPAEDCDGEARIEKGADDLWAEVSSCLCSITSDVVDRRIARLADRVNECGNAILRKRRRFGKGGEMGC